ncbi:hypothetical protein DdX_01623 [Ditylenchus destructor]|uniref:Uncharacterized protein n=1 Tax=Ditylenchus destructor TaxID=166010 RepID=A0AAD4NH81_9BILA|nr:hypothetical protein DdX_01623 [Ditylenchus destructor]
MGKVNHLRHKHGHGTSNNLDQSILTEMGKVASYETNNIIGLTAKMNAVPNNHKMRRITEESYIYESQSQPGGTICRELVSDEFRFLEERNTIRPKPVEERNSHSMNRRTYSAYSNEPGGSRKYSVFSYRKYAVVTLAIIQLLVSVGLITFAITRYRRLLQGSQQGSQNLLLDFTKAEDYAGSNQEGTSIIAIKLGSSIFVPAVLQFLCSITALLFPLYRRPPKYFMILHLMFSSFSVVLWMESTFLAALELNLRNVQLNAFYEGINFRVMVFVTALMAIDVLLVNSVLIIYAAAQLSSNAKTLNSTAIPYVNMVALLAALSSLALSAYTTASSMTNVASWPTPIQNIAVLYGLGLRELIVTSYVLCSVIYGNVITILRHKSLRMGAIVTQGISLFAVILYLLNSDRITAVTHNVQTMTAVNVTTPFSSEIMIVLYCFITLLALALLAQLTSTIINVFQFPPVETYAAPINLPTYGIGSSSMGGEGLQRSAL